MFSRNLLIIYKKFKKKNVLNVLAVMYEKLGFQYISPLCTLNTYVWYDLLICDVYVMVTPRILWSASPDWVQPTDMVDE